MKPMTHDKPRYEIVPIPDQPRSRARWTDLLKCLIENKGQAIKVDAETAKALGPNASGIRRQVWERRLSLRSRGQKDGSLVLWVETPLMPVGPPLL